VPQANASVASEASVGTPAAQDGAVPTGGDGGGFAAGEGELGFTCPICRADFQVGELIRRCQECVMLHHEECWTEVGGCGTFGCKQAPPIDKSEQFTQTPLTAWGDTKECPVCGEKIKSIALSCRYCGMVFNSVDPLSSGDLRLQAQRNSEIERFKKIVAANFAISIIGVLAPVTLLCGLTYLLPKRELLVKCGPLFVIMGWTAIALSGMYCLLIGAFILAASLR
jgi:predicted RNA-binding Zn-ribbon protein involved in translation (DUF1610 family)